MPAARFLQALSQGGEALNERVLIVCAHPDDETIGLGGQLHRLAGVHLLHITDGAPRDGRDALLHGFAHPSEYAQARRGELLMALRLAGIDALRTRSLDLPDQTAAHDLPGLTQGIGEHLATLRPALVVTHAFEGGHPDHDAAAFGVHASAARLPEPPAIIEMTGYHARGSGTVVGRFLPARGNIETVLELDAVGMARKRRMLDCFVTQRATLKAFSVGPERLRPAPHYDFGKPPHDGKLHYESFDWGMTGADFAQRARDALT